MKVSAYSLFRLMFCIWCVVSGQFYVMMSPQDVLDAQRQIAPKTGLLAAASVPPAQPTLKPCAREGRRKVLHNEGKLTLHA